MERVNVKIRIKADLNSKLRERHKRVEGCTFEEFLADIIEADQEMWEDQ